VGLTFTRAALENAVQPGGTSDWVRDSLLKWVDHWLASRPPYDATRLHTGADLSPDACSRRTWYSLRGAPRDPLTLEAAFQLRDGDAWEALAVEGLRFTYPDLETQVLVHPLRPSSWCWSPGRIDALVPSREHICEVKAPGDKSFDLARGGARRLVKTQHRWQLSRYLHEARAAGLAKTASFLFMGRHQPLEVPLEGELLVPLDAIIEREVALAPLLTQEEPPDRIASTVEVYVWKGPRTTKKNPTLRRKVVATERRSWRCSSCEFLGHCQPGPETTVRELTPLAHRAALAHAEQAWTNGDKTTPQVVRYGPAGDEDETTTDEGETT
jgi:hypothetical protein